jgi:hemimethylated DNA binding protein
LFSLLRVRNTQIVDHFKRFDSASKSFVPNEILAYEFPSDLLEECRHSLPNETLEQASSDVISAVQDLANHLRNIIRGNTSAPRIRRLKILELFFDRLTKISDGNVPTKDRYSLEPLSAERLAAWHLHQLHDVVIDIGELLWQKRRSVECQQHIKFALGDVVQHQHFGFRGVVVAWDPQPTVDVSMWDGLQHIKDPHKFPFYHIIPDRNDCIEAFGGERYLRYVCEQNLEICPADQRNIEVDLGPDWERHHSDAVYIPPDDLKVSQHVPSSVEFWLSYLLLSTL